MWKPHSNNNNGHFRVLQQIFMGFFMVLPRKLLFQIMQKRNRQWIVARDAQWSSILCYFFFCHMITKMIWSRSKSSQSHVRNVPLIGYIIQEISNILLTHFFDTILGQTDGSFWFGIRNKDIKNKLVPMMVGRNTYLKLFLQCWKSINLDSISCINWSCVQWKWRTHFSWRYFCRLSKNIRMRLAI